MAERKKRVRPPAVPANLITSGGRTLERDCLGYILIPDDEIQRFSDACEMDLTFLLTVVPRKERLRSGDEKCIETYIHHLMPSDQRCRRCWITAVGERVTDALWDERVCYKEKHILGGDDQYCIMCHDFHSHIVNRYVNDGLTKCHAEMWPEVVYDDVIACRATSAAYFEVQRDEDTRRLAEAWKKDVVSDEVVDERLMTCEECPRNGWWFGFLGLPLPDSSS